MCKFLSKSGGVPFQPLGDLTRNDPTAISNFDSETCNTPRRDCGKVERGRSARIYDNVL